MERNAEIVPEFSVSGNHARDRKQNASTLIFYRCCNKLPKLDGFKVTELFSLTVVEDLKLE